MGKCLDIHRDVLPYCVAHSLCRPEAAQSCDEFVKGVDRFLFIAEAYRAYCLQHKQARKAKAANPFVDIESLLKVDFWALPPARQTDIKPYSFERMVEYAKRAHIACPDKEPASNCLSPHSD